MPQEVLPLPPNVHERGLGNQAACKLVPVLKKGYIPQALSAVSSRVAELPLAQNAASNQPSTSKYIISRFQEFRTW